MVKGSITIRNREFKTTIYDGRTYIEPKLTGTVIGTVVHVAETDEGWELLLLQESYHMIGFWVTVSKDEVKKYNLDEPEVNDPLRIDTLYRNSLDKDGVPSRGLWRRGSWRRSAWRKRRCGQPCWGPCRRRRRRRGERNRRRCRR